MKQDASYFVSLKGLINRNGKILLLRDPQMDYVHQIELPGGKMQVGETDFRKTLKREIFEETGLKIKVGKPFDITYFAYSSNSKHRNTGKQIFIVVFECQYESGNVKLSNEHDSYWWVDKASFNNIFTSKSNLYKIVEKYFNGK